MVMDPVTEKNLLNLDGMAALTKHLDGTLRVFLLKDTPEVRKVVLDVIGDTLPVDKVIFEPQEPVIQCSFCGKLQKEVFMLVESRTRICRGKEIAFPVHICNECVAHCAQLISDAKDISR